MKLSIIGSRTFNDYEIAKQVIFDILYINNYEITEIISGGAKGADTLGKRYAMMHGIPFVEYKPDWSIGKHAGLLRNTLIIENSDIVIAFWDGKSKGTVDSMKKAKKLNKILYVFNFETNTYINF